MGAVDGDLVEVDGGGFEARLRRGACREAAQDVEDVIGRGERHGHGLLVVWFQLRVPQLLEITLHDGQVVADVVHDAFRGSAEHRVTFGDGDFRFEDRADSAATDGVGESDGQDRDHDREEVPARRSIEHRGDQNAGQSEVSEGSNECPGRCSSPDRKHWFGGECIEQQSGDA